MMRCKKCNVDLGEEYKRCPLCGSPAENEEPLIKGQRTAEYPDIVYRKNPPWYFGIFSAVYLISSAAAIAADCLINKTVSNAMWAVFILPCVWAIVFRPVFIKKLYFGSYIIHDAVYLSLLMLWFSKSHLGNFGPAIRFGIPLLSLSAAVILFVGLFFFPQRRKNAATYLIAIGACNVLLLVICLAYGYTPWWCAAAVAVCAAIIAGLCVAMPKEIRDELAARFRV